MLGYHRVLSLSWKGNFAMIKHLCSFHIKPAPISSQAVRFGDNLFLFLNVSRLYLHCTLQTGHSLKFSNVTTVDTEGHLQFIYPVGCGCRAQTEGFEIPFGSLHCADNLSISVNQCKKLVSLKHGVRAIK